MTPGGPARWTEIRSLFEELVELEPGERDAKLRRVPDEDLRDRVAKLLAADSEADRFLEAPAVAVAGGLLDGLDAGLGDEPLPERIGPYRVLERLGRGGMGDVLLAERADGLYEQRVAIKLLRRGLDSEDFLRRFARERRILARLEHPNIARILDGGATDDGRPYFVMERVQGESITTYCRERNLSLDDRVRLVVACCDAVAAAHRSLAVHRDLKPSNVLVTAEGGVKLLDFGIAKALGESEEDAGEKTRADLRLLTPSYAAPEQILGEPVTTATDVWALGAILYELVTGGLPQRREGRSAAELATLADREPVERPGLRVQREKLDVLPLAAHSESARRRLARALRGDLDNILLMALRREPDRRYVSAAALADDLRRHLAKRPVRARPDTVAYRVGRFVRRQRAGVAAAALVLIALVAGLAATVWQARRAERNATAATAAARRAEGVKEFLIGLFEVADPEQASGGSVTASELLDQAGQRLRTELASEPDIQADLLEAVARIDKGLGRLDAAEDLAKRSLEIRQRVLPAGDAAIGRSLATLGAVRMSRGQLDEAEKELSRALAVLRAKEPPDSLATARAQSDYGQVLFWKGDATGAEKSERDVYETYRRVLGDGNAQTAMHLRNLGVLLDELDRPDEAEKAYRDSQAILSEQLGPDHVNLAYSYVNLAVLLAGRRGQTAEAEGLYRRSLEIRRRELGSKHPTVGQTLQLSGLFYLNQGRLEESEALYREALALFRGIDPRHFEIGKCLNGLALVASRRGQYAEAEKTMAEVETFFREVLGDKHPFTWQVRGNRASQIALQGRLEEAEEIERGVVAKLEELNGKDSSEAVDARARLAETLRRRGRVQEALPLHRQALEAVRRMEGEDSAWTAMLRYQVAADLIAGGDPAGRAEAKSLLDRSLAILEKQAPPHHRLAEIRAASATLRGN